MVLRYVDFFNRGDLDALESLFSRDARIQGVLGAGQFEKIAPIWRQLMTGYGMQLHVQGLVAEGNSVAARYIEKGTFEAPALGVEPAGKFCEPVAMAWSEIDNDRVLRRWGARDAASQACKPGIPLST